METGQIIGSLIDTSGAVILGGAVGITHLQTNKETGPITECATMKDSTHFQMVLNRIDGANITREVNGL
jgi:hypothetical protein